MALTSWKTFNFFDVSPVKPPDDVTASVFENLDISCVCSGSESVFLGSSDGTVRILSKAFKVISSFDAHDAGSITHMKQVEGTSLLVTVAEDLSNEPILKVWALDKTDKKTGIPRCQSTINIQNGRKQFPISTFAALDDLSQLAVGFANGAVTVIRGDLIHDRGAKQRVVFESEEPITGVEFQEAGRTTTLYVSTTSRIFTLVISGKGQGQPARILEDAGCGVGCMTIDKRNGDVVVVREDAIYYYGPNGRGPCYAFEGPKTSVDIYRNCVVLVSPPQSGSTRSAAPLRRFGGQAEDLFNTSTFTLLDTELKYVAHSESLVSSVKAIIMEWGDLFLLTIDGKLFRYREKPLSEKLEILFQRNLYVLAINLAQRSGVDVMQQNAIFRRYGDYLYQKGDFDGAMQQYLRAIDNTEPSQVIRKFLDTQRIHNLIEYLEELHEHHKATSDHTTLLLNCYAKLKDVDKLEKFIKSPGDLKFDLDTAISMCRQGGYYSQAAYLATKHGEHDLVVTILIEDSKQYAEALEYIRRLDPDTTYRNLLKYARVLLEHCPKDATQLFIEYYNGRYRPRSEVVTQSTAPSTSQPSGAMQNLASLLPLPYMNTSSLASPGTPGAQKSTVAQAQITEAKEPDPIPEYDMPRPRTAFSSFVDHPDEFIVFLEACLTVERPDVADKTDLYTTLFEMYLHKANVKGQERAEWETKAKKLIENSDIPIDTSNVLLLSHLSNFPTGTHLVREQLNLHLDIFRSYASAKDTQGAIKALHKYGTIEPALYPAALSYFTSSPRVLEEAGDELGKVLDTIDAQNLMAPLQVIQMLSKNAVATMGLVRDYLSRMVEREEREIENNKRLITSYRAETAAKRAEMDQLNTRPATFQTSRCSACGGSLDLPTVHFLCKHSFHQRCLNLPATAAATTGRSGSLAAEDVGECPVCKGGNDTVRAIRRAQEESAEKHGLFLDALGRSTDKFGTVGEFFGRGVVGRGGGVEGV
ncbi:MAG: hypothetical protein M1817_005548 [Caeruleum heppii]|nr:MAG: hypothetical protein M1817_005548 [Caeruleum heppii]